MPYLNKLYQLPQFAGIGMDKIDCLIAEKLITKEDFAKVTENEVLFIRGIGKVTIKKLKENGVVFEQV